MGKRESPKSWGDTGDSVHGAFKMDYLQHAKLISFQKISTFWPFILGGPIPYYPRERRKGSSRGRKWEKGNHPKVDETQGFQYLGHSNWTIWSLLNWLCSKKFPTFCPSYWEVQLLITPETGRKEAAGTENGEKGITQKLRRHRGFCTWGIQNGLLATC